MFETYNDITNKLGPPLWWDSNGVPRYKVFHPSMMGVYVDYAALISISCQGCNRRLKVGWDFDPLHLLCYIPGHPAGDEVWAKSRFKLPDKESPGSVGYGDAPAHYDGMDRLCSGCTMTTDVTRIHEFWRKDKKEIEWKRDHSLEFEYE